MAVCCAGFFFVNGYTSKYFFGHIYDVPAYTIGTEEAALHFSILAVHCKLMWILKPDVGLRSRIEQGNMHLAVYSCKVH